MKKHYFTILAYFALTSNINAQIAADYLTETIGVLSGVTFEFSNFSNTTDPTFQSFSGNLSTVEFSGAPLSNSEIMYQINSNTSWTVTFNSAIPNLKLYCNLWKTVEVEFDQPFTILSGGSSFVNPSGNQLNTTTFTNGIILFTNPITSLNLTVLSGENGYTGLTFGLDQLLSLNDNGVEIDKKIKLYPNPLADSIQISGLKNSENYTVFCLLGKEMLHGIISNGERIAIENLNNGIYFLKFDNGNTLKFVKE
jgi:hypothetical protein